MSHHAILASFLTCILAGFVPLVNAEVVAVGAALLLAPSELMPLIAACAAGQMVAKLSVYGLARWSPRHLPRRARDSLARAGTLRKRKGGTWLLVLVSSGVGLPPFYLVTLGAGVVGVPFPVFAGAGLAGTLLRYSVLIWGATRFAPGSGLPFS